MALEAVAPFLACPHCAAELAVTEHRVSCGNGHRYDVARQGYVTLTTGRRASHVGDTAEMVAARADFLGAGHFDPIATAVRDALGPLTGGCVVDLGAGTGHTLATVLDHEPQVVGIALDASTYAARRAARIHPRIGAVVADVWGRLPIRSGSQAAVCTVFAPRHPVETARVLASDGRYVVVTPTEEHLRGLRERLGLLDVGADKLDELDGRLRPHFALEHRVRREFRLPLAGPELARLVAMGPSSWHVASSDIRDLRETSGITEVAASVDISRYRRLAERHTAR